MLDLLDYSIGYLSSIINSYDNNSYSYNKNYVQEELDELNKKLEKINNFLIKDGFSISNGKIIRTIPSVVNIQEREDLLFTLLDKHNFDIPKGHINQAIHNFTDGNWASCNSQLRSFVEGLFNIMAEKINNITYKKSSSARTSLSYGEKRIYYPELNEWDDNGTGFINGFWKRLHPEGSHQDYQINMTLLSD